MGSRTPIYPLHIEAGAKLVDFGGWDMPVNYGSQIEEHHAVRTDVGMCDVSHMTVVDVSGSGATDYLRYLLCNDVIKLAEPGRALYSGMLNDEGGVLDDLIVYRNEDGYRVVVNCATREKDLAWMASHTSNFEVSLSERPDLAIIAVQGPNSFDKVQPLLPGDGAALLAGLKPFRHGWAGDWFVARTGYTGEKGVELIVSAEDAVGIWKTLASDGVRPVGLGARDTLRLEAGMNLYGSDMDETVTPFESNMDITVVFDNDHEFIGRKALERQLELGVERKLIGLVMKDRGVLRAHYEVFSGDDPVGEITSGAYSPTLSHSIALARVSASIEGALTVDIRGKRIPVERVNFPFVRNGKQVYKPI